MYIESESLIQLRSGTKKLHDSYYKLPDDKKPDILKIGPSFFFFFFFFFFYRDGLGCMACSHSELINSGTMNLIDSR
jgi:hypothetical protein